MSSDKKAFAIVVGGGPAPGINGVISAVTIEAVNAGHKVYGIKSGFKKIAAGDPYCMQELTIGDVAWIHRQGGSVLATSRSNPLAYPDMMQNILRTLREHNVGYLITIGGDGSAACSNAISKHLGSEFAVAHVPKTIDNDLPLPAEYSTFGYQTARHVGTDIVKTLMLDAKTTERWYLTIAQGRKAGHLALGIGVSAGATMSIIPEEFGGSKVALQHITDIIVGSVVKRYITGRPYGVAVLAEGLAACIEPSSLPELEKAERDMFGNIRFADFDFGEFLKRSVRETLSGFGLGDMPIVEKNVGYELRCRDPIPFDQEYTRMLGFGAVKFLLGGGNRAMIARVGGALSPISFSEFINEESGVSNVRMVDTESMYYRMASSYQIRLTQDDLNNDSFVKEFAQAINKDPEFVIKRFTPVVK